MTTKPPPPLKEVNDLLPVDGMSELQGFHLRTAVRNTKEKNLLGKLRLLHLSLLEKNSKQSIACYTINMHGEVYRRRETGE